MPRYVPPYPPRGLGPVAAWRGLIGERARTAVYGWSESAFETGYLRRDVFGFRVHIPLTPALVQRVLLDNAANYVKPDIVKRLLAPMIGEGLLTADGEPWRAQRRIVAANFAPAAVDALTPVFARAAHSASASWREGETRDMAAEATSTTMRVIADALFAGDPRLVTPRAIGHIAAALEGAGGARVQALLGIPNIGWSRKLRAARRGRTFLRETLGAVVRERLPDGGPDDFLGRLIRALGERFDDSAALELAVDNAATFYLAGHETTSNAMTWTLFLLAAQPGLQEAAAAEAGDALSGDEDGLTDRLPLLRRVLEESLRLYPPVPRLDRQAAGADALGEEEVRPGDIISIWPWILHRHKALWDDPDAFDADRFLPAAKAQRHRFQYLPFGGGPRVCVGMRFAGAEALTILAHWLARWRFEPVAGHEARASGMVTLRPAGGLPLRLSPRGRAAALIP